MDLRELGRENVDWITLVRDRCKERTPVNKVMNFLVPYKVSNVRTM